MLTEVLRQDGQDREQVKFWELLLKLFTLVFMPAKWKMLQICICLARGPRVMLTYTDAGLVNRAMGTVQAICYQNGSQPSLLVAVIVKFDKYCGQIYIMEVFQLSRLSVTYFDTRWWWS